MKWLARTVLFTLVVGFWSLFFINSTGWWAPVWAILSLAIAILGLAAIIWLSMKAFDIKELK